MALETQLASIGTDYIKPMLDNNWMNSSPFLKLLKSKGKVITSGNTLRFPITYTSTGNATWYTGTQEIPAEEGDEITSVKYEWKQLGGQVVYHGTELLKLDGDTAKINLVKAKSQNVVDTVADMVATEIFNVGTSVLRLDGLRLMVDSTGTYPNSGGIATADFSGWAGQEDTATNTLTRLALEDLIMDCSGSGDDYPTVIVTNAPTFAKVKSLVTPQERWESSDTIKIGFRSMTFNGIPIVIDKHSPGSGTGSTNNWIFILNDRHLAFYINSHENFKFGPTLEPITQNAKAQKYLFAGALVCTRRDRQGALQAVDPAL